MLIRSQDRTKLVDIAGKTIAIDRANAIVIMYSNSNFLLGKYTSKEKAIKVLDMIQETYKQQKTEMIYREGIYDIRTFQMPEDNEVIL